MYKVWHPASGIVFGVFSNLQDAQTCLHEHYTTAKALQPVLERVD